MPAGAPGWKDATIGPDDLPDPVTGALELVRLMGNPAKAHRDIRFGQGGVGLFMAGTFSPLPRQRWRARSMHRMLLSAGSAAAIRHRSAKRTSSSRRSRVTTRSAPDSTCSG